MAVFVMHSVNAPTYPKGVGVWHCTVCSRELGVASLSESAPWRPRRPVGRALPPSQVTAEATDWIWVRYHSYKFRYVRLMRGRGSSDGTLGQP
jgi:hypothetical protein